MMIVYTIGIIIVTSMAIYVFTHRNSKKKVINDPPNTLRLIDESIDHVSSVMDFISPKVNVFDKPQKICDQISECDSGKLINIILTTHGGELESCEKMIKSFTKEKEGYIINA